MSGVKIQNTSFYQKAFSKSVSVEALSITFNRHTTNGDGVTKSKQDEPLKDLKLKYNFVGNLDCLRLGELIAKKREKSTSQS